MNPSVQKESGHDASPLRQKHGVPQLSTPPFPLTVCSLAQTLLTAQLYT